MCFVVVIAIVVAIIVVVVCVVHALQRLKQRRRVVGGSIRDKKAARNEDETEFQERRGGRGKDEWKNGDLEERNKMEEGKQDILWLKGG